MATDKLINQSQGADIIDALDDIATNLSNISYGEQTSADKVVAMTGYQKASTAESISPGDSLNEAVGKLEKKVDDNATSIESKVSGPERSVRGDIAIYNDATGKVLDDSGITIVDSSEGVIETDGSIPTCMAVSDFVMGIAADLVGRIDDKTLPIQSDLATLEGLPMGRLNIPNIRDIISEEFVTKTWSGLTSFDGWRIWSDGLNIYYSDGSDQYVLDKSNSTWSKKTWFGLTSFYASQIWTDGENIYYSNGSSTQYVLNKSTSTWITKTWNGLTSFYGSYIWTDGDNIYCSNGSDQYVLNKATSTWSTKTWTGLTSFYSVHVWTDGENIYYSFGSTDQYVLNKSTSTWSAKTWFGFTSFYGKYIWTDGRNIYLSNDLDQYVLDKSTSTWNIKTWSSLTSFSRDKIWTDGINFYYSSGSTQYLLKRNTPNTQEVMGYVNDQTDTKVTGPGSSYTDAIAIYSDTTGKVLADSQVTIERVQLDEANDKVPTCEVVTGAIMAMGADLSEDIVYVANQIGKNNLINLYAARATAANQTIATGIPFNGKSGQTYVISYNTSLTTGVLTFGMKNGDTSVQSVEVGNSAKVKKFTLSGDTDKFNIFSSVAGTFSNFIICTEEEWNLSHGTDYCTLLNRVKYNTNMGVKNICNNAEFNNGTKTGSNVTFATLPDGTVTVKTPSGQTSTTDANIFYNAWFKDGETVIIPEGTWMCKLYGTDIANIRIEYAYRINGVDSGVERGNFGEAFEMTIPTGISASWLRICAKPSTSFNSSFKIVVCNKAAWEADPPTEYIPFAKSNYQLTADIDGKLDKTANATSAAKLNNGTTDYSVGSATKGVYFNNGIPAEMTYSVGANVPAGAVFTDTNTYVSGAAFADNTSSDANNPLKLTLSRSGSVTTAVTGTLPKVSSSSAGVVPKGAAVSSQSQTTKFLREDGTWAKPSYTTNTNTTYTFATGTTNGAFSVTPSGGSAQSVPIYGLGSAAYTESSAYATSGHNHNLSIAAAASGATASINLSANTIYTLTAGGKTYNFKTPADNNTYPSAYCSTAAATAAKVATCTGYALLSKSYIQVIITTANTSASALTLNINSKGAKPIYINGSASSSSNYTLPAGSYLVYYNGTNYYFRTDGKVTAAGIIDIGGNTGKYFKGDGTLATPYTHPTTAGNKHIPSGGSSGQVLIYGGSSGTAAWGLPDKLNIRSTKALAPLKTWTTKTWSGLTNFSGWDIWTDDENIYYTTYSGNYVLNKSTSTWSTISWPELVNVYGSGREIWTDGTNIYYSYGSYQHVFNGSSWPTKTWSGLTNFSGSNIWTDGANIYCSESTTQYVLNGSTWTKKTWSGLTDFSGRYVWSDGSNIYYSDSTTQYVLNGSTWTTKTWSGLTSFYGDYVWTDGINVYYSSSTNHYVLNGSTWTKKTWSGLTDFNGSNIWTDGTNIYHSQSSNQYILTDKVKSVR